VQPPARRLRRTGPNDSQLPLPVQLHHRVERSILLRPAATLEHTASTSTSRELTPSLLSISTRTALGMGAPQQVPAAARQRAVARQLLWVLLLALLATLLAVLTSRRDAGQQQQQQRVAAASLRRGRRTRTHPTAAHTPNAPTAQNQVRRLGFGEWLR
jgi:hypothetical protein